MKYAIIMAAGKGTRMNSDVPKVMHKVCQKPMVEHLIDNLKKAQAEEIVTVVGFNHEMVETAMAGKCEFALQEPQLGTGHAVMQARQLEGKEGITLVANGDCPCLKPATFEKLYESLSDGSKMAVLTTMPEDAAAYGRVVRDEQGFIRKIVEFKDCSEEEKAIREINTGIYCFDNKVLFESLSEIKNNNKQNEYYITDLVEILLNKGHKVKAVIAEDTKEVAGINDNVELARANKYLQAQINYGWMKKGVTIVDPDDTYIGPDVQIGRDVTIYPNVYIEGHSVVGDFTTLMPQTFLVNTKVGNNCTIDASRITDSEVKDNTTVGPFVNLHNNSVVK